MFAASIIRMTERPIPAGEAYTFFQARTQFNKLHVCGLSIQACMHANVRVIRMSHMSACIRNDKGCCQVLTDVGFPPGAHRCRRVVVHEGVGGRKGESKGSEAKLLFLFPPPHENLVTETALGSLWKKPFDGRMWRESAMRSGMS